MFEGTTTLWVVHLSNDEASAERAQKEGFICIGWTRISDLSPYTTREADKRE